MNGDSPGLLSGPAHLGCPVVLFPQGHPVWREAEGGEVAAPDPETWEGLKGAGPIPSPHRPPAGNAAVSGTEQ